MEDAHSSKTRAKSLLVGAVGVILAGYALAVGIGWPQYGTSLVVEAQHHPVHADHEHDAAGDDHARGEKHVDRRHDDDQAASARAGQARPEAHEAPGAPDHPPYLSVIPFVLLLGAIAVLPLIPAIEHWWESNLHRFYVAAGLGILTLIYYLVLHDKAVLGHWPAHYSAAPNPDGLNWEIGWAVLANAILAEYIPFIMLLFSLYTISGGIRIEGDLPARPRTNTTFIAAGGLLASFVGTTGAAMLLIRVLLETNSKRRHVRHTVIFFIFVVCNCGGCLLPIGDPPLFLGYLRGVPFLWTFKLWPQWLFVNGMLLAVYYLIDRFWYYPREEKGDATRIETAVRGLRFSGLWPNAALLAGVVFSVGLLDPSKPVPGTDWHPWLYLREIVQLGLVAISLLWGSDELRRSNSFTYHAIIEVAALFSGIFICMQPPLQILHVKGPSLPISTPMHFFWLTGALSSALDNAPTYIVFFETAKSLGGERLVAGVAEPLLIGISLGAVFMGAMTYIGNGPNFMVKAIAEKSGVRMPSFFGYMVYSGLFLVPLLIVTTWLFL
jgi:Na+/H+ antiporter NhaD/arsenite permease-like protein